jgi:lipopolysaccharide export system protein LptC
MSENSDSVENFNQPKKNNGVYLLIIIVLLVALAFMAYLLSSKNKEINNLMNANKELEADMQGMNDMLSSRVEDGSMTNDLKKDFTNMLEIYDQLIEKDKSKADSLNVQKEKIQGLLDQISRNKKLSAREIFTLRKENETLRNIMKGYVHQIDSLNTLNIQLNSDLSTKTTQLNKTIEERNQFKTDAESSAAQVKKGSKLQAFGFSSAGLRLKLNNTTEETSKARNCVQIKSSFTISENPLTPAGRKSVYMQIISPDGKVLQSKSSNVVSTDIGNIAYSDRKEIDYSNQSVDVAIFYDLAGEDIEKGNYKVKIFCDGQLIGSDSFTLK